MKTIWKFPLKLTEYQQIYMPNGDVDILSVGLQDDVIMLWAMVNPKSDGETLHYFEIFGSGHDIHEGMGIERKYIGTVQTGTGFVWHIFERLN